MGDSEVLTEVPAALKRLVRYIIRGFYSVEHAIIVDMLVHHPCVKEDDLCELIKFERKAVRGLINTLKNDKFLKSKVRIETSTDGKQSHHTYYFINYSSFVNVVKYKLDHMRKKIEMEERESTSRASFKCPSCDKTYTDLEADQLFDFVTQKFLCTYCRNEVEEEASSVPRQDARTLMVKFNEQVEPLFTLLSEVEDIKLAPSILEPEPVDLKAVRDHRGSGGGRREGVWSGANTKGLDYGVTENQVTIEMEGQDRVRQVQEQLIKERPIWMVESTVEGASNDSTSMSDKPSKPGTSKEQAAASNSGNDDIIFKTLLAHETKTRREKIPGLPTGPGGAGGSDDGGDTTSSESEDEYAKPSNTIVVPAASTITQDTGGGGDVEEMEDDDDDDEEETMVSIGGSRVPYHEVTDDMVANMSPAEKEQYIKIGQEMYQNMYE